MIIHGNLSLSQQERGRNNFHRFNFINGLSYICVGETIIILFAIRMGCPDYTVAILGSFFFLSNFCMPLGKLLMARIGAIRTIAMCWAMRNLSILVVAAAPLFSWFAGTWAATTAIIVGAFSFYACRSIGVIGMQPVMGELTTAENRGKFTSRSNGLFYLANLIMLGVIMMVMRYTRETWVFVATIGDGAFLGLVSTWFISRIDETEAISQSAAKPVLADVLLTLKNSMRLRQLAANCAISSAITLTVPISMLALKKGYGISDDSALLFALIQMAGAVATSYVIGLLAEETGPRPLAILFYCLLIVLCLLWVIGPDTFKWYYMIWPFVLAGAAVIGTGVSMTHYFLIAIPNKERVAASLTMYVISGVAAGVVGSVVGGGIFRFLDTLGMTPIDMFQRYFLIVLFILLAGLPLMSRLTPLADWKISEVLGLAFAPKDIITLLTLYRIKQVADPGEERENIDKLLVTHSGLSEKALISYLDSPKFSLRGRALSALGEIPFGRRTVAALLPELEEGEYTTAHIAAQIAGERNLKEAIPLLRKHLDSKDLYLQGKAMLALAQLRDADSYDMIREIFRATDNPRLITHGAAAMAEIADDAAFATLLRKTTAEMPEKVLYEVIYSIMLLAGHGDDIYHFLRLYQKNKNSALLFLSELSHGDVDIREDEKKLIFDYDSGNLSRNELKTLLAKDFVRSSYERIRSIGTFIQSEDAELFPGELLLCLLPLRTEDALPERQ